MFGVTHLIVDSLIKTPGLVPNRPYLHLIPVSASREDVGAIANKIRH